MVGSTINTCTRVNLKKKNYIKCDLNYLKKKGL